MGQREPERAHITSQEARVVAPRGRGAHTLSESMSMYPNVVGSWSSMNLAYGPKRPFSSSSCHHTSRCEPRHSPRTRGSARTLASESKVRATTRHHAPSCAACAQLVCTQPGGRMKPANSS